MAHFELSQWVDFVRGLVPSDAAASLRIHLEEGCADCRRTEAALRAVAEDARAECESPAPDHAVRSAKACFALQRPRPAPAGSLLSLSKVFDSELAPAAAGSRVLHDASRQLFFQSEDYALDVRIDRLADSRRAIVVGQLLMHLGEPVVHAPAFLTSRGRVASSAFTGQLGSFQMEADLDGPVELWLFPGPDRRISVTLERSDTEAADQKPIH